MLGYWRSPLLFLDQPPHLPHYNHGRKSCSQTRSLRQWQVKARQEDWLDSQVGQGQASSSGVWVQSPTRRWLAVSAYPSFGGLALDATMTQWSSTTWAHLLKTFSTSATGSSALKTVLLLADQLVSPIVTCRLSLLLMIPNTDILYSLFLQFYSLWHQAWQSLEGHWQAWKLSRSISLTLASLRSSMTPGPTSYSIQGEHEPHGYCSLQYSDVKQACRGDLESLAYVLMYVFHRVLFWQGIKASTKKQKCDQILEKKMTTPTDLLYRSFPSSFGVFPNYTCAMHFDDKLDYLYLHRAFCGLFVCMGFQYNYVSTGVCSMALFRKIVLEPVKRLALAEDR